MKLSYLAQELISVDRLSPQAWYAFFFEVKTFQKYFVTTLIHICSNCWNRKSCVELHITIGQRNVLHDVLVLRFSKIF